MCIRDSTTLAVPYPHTVREIVGAEEVQGEYGPALEGHSQVPAIRFDARDVAEAHHERTRRDFNLLFPLQQFDSEDLDRAALPQFLWRHLGDPGVLELGAIEVFAPEGFFVAAEAQAPLVDGGLVGGDSAKDESWVRVRDGLRWRSYLSRFFLRNRLD